MFGKNFVYVLKISKSVVAAYKVDVENLKVVARVTEEHAQDNLAWILEKFKGLFDTDAFRLLIPPDKGFLKLYKINVLQSTKRQVEEQLSIELPEALSFYTYDVRQMTDEDNEGNAYYQVLVADKQYLRSLKTVFDKLKLKVEAIEVAPFALARITRKVEVPHLIFWAEEDEKQVVSAYQGEVFETRYLTSRHKVENALREVVDLTKKNFGLEIAHAFLTPGLKDEMGDLAGQLKTKEEELLSPALGLALKTDIAGADMDVLNLTFPKAQKKGGGNFWLRLPIKKMSVGLVIVVLLAGVIYFARGRWENFNLGEAAQIGSTVPAPTQQPVAPATPEPTPTLTPTPTPLNKQELSIQILNGSGKRGQASEIKALLESKGWKVEKIGNAARYDYAVTEVKIKKSKEVFLQELGKDLQDRFEIKIKENLSEQAPYDAQIILGRS